MEAQINAPIYRALKLNTENEYVIGFFHSRKWDGETRTEYYITYESLEWEIDPTTLAIHFPDMLDSQGNKIFASLSEDGKGGDIIRSEFNHNCIVKYREYFFYADNKEKHINCFGFINSTVIGIQK